MSSQPYHIRQYKPKAAVPAENLSLFLSNDGMMFAHFDKDYQKISELAHVSLNRDMLHQPYSESLRWFLNNFRLNQKKYDHVNLAILNNNYSILPEVFAGKENARNILEFSSGKAARNSFSHHFNQLSFNYDVEQETLAFIEKNFRNVSIRHAGAVAVNLLFNNRSLKKSQLLLNFHDGAFELLAREDKQLLYYNTFEFEGKDDVLYYLLFMMDQFGLDPEIARVSFAGQLEPGGELHTAICKYIRFNGFAVNTLPASAEMGFPDHYYFTLLNQHLCEL